MTLETFKSEAYLVWIRADKVDSAPVHVVEMRTGHWTSQNIWFGIRIIATSGLLQHFGLIRFPPYKADLTVLRDNYMIGSWPRNIVRLTYYYRLLMFLTFSILWYRFVTAVLQIVLVHLKISRVNFTRIFICYLQVLKRIHWRRGCIHISLSN